MLLAHFKEVTSNPQIGFEVHRSIR